MYNPSEFDQTLVAIVFAELGLLLIGDHMIQVVCIHSEAALTEKHLFFIKNDLLSLCKNLVSENRAL